MLSEKQIKEQLKQALNNWVNQKTLMDDEWTALHLACKRDNQTFGYLINHLGADYLLNNKKGVSLMHKAAMDDNNYLLTYLRDKLKFKVSDKDVDGNTPLHYACYNNALWAGIRLIHFGHELNVKNKSGDTPLHILLKS